MLGIVSWGGITEGGRYGTFGGLVLFDLRSLSKMLYRAFSCANLCGGKLQHFGSLCQILRYVSRILTKSFLNKILFQKPIRLNRNVF